MKVVIAPDSFKESLSAAEVAAAIAAGLREVWPQAELVCRPMADGAGRHLGERAKGADVTDIQADDVSGRA